MLSKEQMRLLRETKENLVVRTDKYKIEDVEYLRELGFVTCIQVDKEGDFYYQARISESGKACLYLCKKKNIEIWVPVVISSLFSVSALVISIISLLR